MLLRSGEILFCPSLLSVQIVRAIRLIYLDIAAFDIPHLLSS